jgi:hypothetical protein
MAKMDLEFLITRLGMGLGYDSCVDAWLSGQTGVLKWKICSLGRGNAEVTSFEKSAEVEVDLKFIRSVTATCRF